jgi:ketosteroid isomerase-like protein
MSDQATIQQVINRYTDGCNRQDWAQVLGTFTEDGVWEAAGSAHTGHATIQAVMAGFLATMDYFVQTASASVITVEGDTAAARTTIRESGKFGGRDEGLEILGYYEDRIVRTAAGWQFAHRTFNLFGMHRFPLVAGPALG